jgi:hypothetical protein
MGYPRDIPSTGKAEIREKRTTRENIDKLYSKTGKPRDGK